MYHQPEITEYCILCAFCTAVFNRQCLQEDIGSKSLQKQVWRDIVHVDSGTQEGKAVTKLDRCDMDSGGQGCTVCLLFVPYIH